MTARTKKKKGPMGVGNIINDIRGGKTVSLQTLRTNAWIIVVAIISVIALMGLRYETKTKMEQIKKLNIELQRAESSKLQEKAMYMSLIRETEMKRMVEEKGLPLEFQDQPPYEIVND